MFTNCNDTPEPVEQTVTTQSQIFPSWYTQSEEESSLYLYGYGMDKSRKAAINDALNDAVSTLQVSVSSSYSKDTYSRVNNGVEDYDEDREDHLEVITGTLALNNYKVLKHQKISNTQHVVKIRINKQKLFQSFYNDLENSFKMLEVQLQDKTHDLEKILIYRHYLAILKREMGTLKIMRSLNPGFDSSEFTTQYKALKHQYNLLVEHKRFKLEVNDPSHAYKEQIKQGLILDGVKLTRKEDYDYLVHVDITEKQRIAVRREVITYLSTTFSVSISNRVLQKELFFTTFKLTSQSDESLAKARELLNEKLRAKIQEHGVFNIKGE